MYLRRINPGLTTQFRFCISHIRFLSAKHSMLPLDHRIFVCSLRLLPFPLDYNFLISSRLSNFMFSTSTHMFWTSRFICFQLRFLYIRLRIRNIRLRIPDIRFRIRNIRLRLKYYCSYFCPQRNAIAH